jgi:hypothetical protein
MNGKKSYSMKPIIDFRIPVQDGGFAKGEEVCL